MIKRNSSANMLLPKHISGKNGNATKSDKSRLFTQNYLGIGRVGWAHKEEYGWPQADCAIDLITQNTVLSSCSILLE